MIERSLPGGVTCFEVEAKSVLNRVAGMPFGWSINPYRGCQHRCVFCYARRTHWFLEEDGIGAWGTRIYAKVNAPEVLRRELKRPSWKGEDVALGTATDPYQAIEGTYRITRRILQALHEARTPVHIITRSPLVVRDADILEAMARRVDVSVAVSIATLDAPLAREIEPTVAPPAKRLFAVQSLAARGIRAGIALAPILPAITDAPEGLARVMKAARDCGASFAWSTALNLGDVTRDAFFGYLRERHPDLVPLYDRLYGGKYAPADYRRMLAERVRAARAAFPLDPPPLVEPDATGEQLALI